MAEAIWKGETIAESDDTILVEGNHYFPREAVRDDLLEGSSTHTVCGWKGTADYFTVVVGEERNVDAAWTYPDPKPEAEELRDRVAFWKGVEIRE